ncbi:hypothetical protein PHMEG_00020450 [Phytophthora megakarya]|uniref:BED-type domain-containing protein n=1 Tax=Phytophthora megakarya TaxID=4795 RepID=A0A225VQW1_9STRA|nr:hypothetical protein PHMEG_00020450 [Phytophthora megakarya]
MSSTNQPISNKLVCSRMFTKKSRVEYLCSICSKSYKSAHGYTNLITHLRTYHPSYLEDASRAAKVRNALCVRVVDDETRNIFHWCERVVMDSLPLRFVERKMTRKNSSLSSISEKTLEKNLMHVYEAAEARVAEELPASFGIVLDGSTFNGRHFIAIFAVFNDPEMCHSDVADEPSEYYSDTDCYTRRFLLLAFCPLGVEEDIGAQSLFDLIADTLSRNNKSWELCTSWFKLAVSDYMADYDALLTKPHALMTKLRTIKEPSQNEFIRF